MDAKVLESLTVLLNQALTLQLMTTALVSLLAAGIGAYVGAYLKKKGERQAAKEDFSGILREQIETTFETEQVKSIIASAASTSLEKFKTELQERLSSLTFWRERAAKLKDMTFDGALTLDTLLENCQSVSWLAKTSTEDIHDRGHVAITRVTYALAQLRQMNVIDAEKSNVAFLLGYNFRSFAGAVAVYQEQIAAGHITPSGGADDTAKLAEEGLLNTVREWRDQLDPLRSVVAWLATAPEPSLDSKELPSSAA